MSLDRLAAALSDRYRIERELGKGGMATVYLAHDIKHDRMVAIKVLRPTVTVELGAERFLREITTTANLHHPHILPLYESGEADGFLFYVMPHIEGESLRQRIDREKQLPVDSAIQIAREVADALGYAHDRGVIHRDVKPENILLEGGHAMVADFGIARAVSMAGTERITQGGVVVGTPTYMSPEQAAGSIDLDGRSDLYGLGCVVYEMFGGQPPFSGATAAVLMRQHLTVDAPPVSNLRPGTPATVVTALQRALAKAPADRFDTVGDFAAALQGSGPVALPAGPSTRRRSTLLVVALALAIIALVAFLWFRRSGASPDGVALSSVAVLPFEDLSPDHASGYFGDGIAETLINALASVAGLHVTGRTSSFALRDQAGNVQEIGKRLGVATVLEGSVQRSGSQLRITAQLIRASDGDVLWSRNFDQDAKDIFAVQDEVARAVVTALQGRVLAQADTALAAHGTSNPAAYDAYLLGRYYWGKRTTADMVTAARYFEQAIAADSGYARAWSGLADSYVLFIPAEYDVPGVSIDSMLDLAERAARRAIALDPGLGEGWISLGEVLEYHNRWVEARQAFKKGIELSLNYPTAHQWYAYDLCIWNRWEDCQREMSRARDLDPMSTVILTSLAGVYDGAERWDQASALYAQVEAVDPGHPLLITFRFWHDLRRGATDRWADGYRQVARLRKADSAASGAIAQQLADSTRRTSALRQLARTSDPYTRLVIAQVLDGDDGAIAVVNSLKGSRDLDQVNAAGIMMLLSPRLRADPRMQAALQRLGYPQY